jgi:multiple sugar transport system ATP-binding protein
VVEPLGAETFLYLTTGAQSFVVRISGEEKVEVNQAISLVFDMRKAHFFDPTTGLAIL